MSEFLMQHLQVLGFLCSPFGQECATISGRSLVHHQCTHMHTGSKQLAVEFDRLQDWESLGSKDDDELGAIAVGEQVAQLGEPIPAAHQYPADLLIPLRPAVDFAAGTDDPGR